MSVGGIGSFSALTSYSGVNSSKANSELRFDKIYQQETDSVEINSTAGNNDIMTIYEMLCSEFPEANYVLEDKSDEENFFFNNIDSRVGNKYGYQGEKSISIDVSVIRKIQEDPSYYVKAKGTLEHMIENYDGRSTNGGKGLPYMTANLDLDGDRLQVSWQYEKRSCSDMIAKEIKNIESHKLSDTINYDYIKDKMDTMLDDFMDKVTEGIVGNDKEGK
jgi:hypothetical protein